jgi:formyltetrahydrofolate hydrolase
MKFVIGYLIDSLYIFSFEKLNNMFVKVIELLNDEKIQMTSKQRTEILNLVSKEEFFLKFIWREKSKRLSMKQK